MKTKHNRLLSTVLTTICCLVVSGLMAQSATHAAAVADTGKTAWFIIGAIAVTLLIMNLKHSIKHIYINLFTKK